MTCDKALQLLHAYVDNELDIASTLEMNQHLASCAKCRKELASLQAVRRAVAQPALYSPASSLLRERLTQAIRAEERKNSPRSESWWQRRVVYSGVAAAILVLIGSAVLFSQLRAQGSIDELLASHVRSLEAAHLLDVESTDQHTVKPWFAAKIDFSPPVVDLAVEGFPLIGGRLDYLEHRTVAALVYRHNKHVINVFIWPGEASSQTDTRQGFHLIRFEIDGMICWAVSDLNVAELQQFVDLFKRQKAASTRS